jgi:hypothetical protein
MSASSGRKNIPEADQGELHENASQKNRVTNMECADRLISSILGGTQLIKGLTRTPLPGLALVATAAPFLYRGTLCHCRVHDALGIDTHRDALNSSHSSNQPYEPTGFEESIEKKHPSSSPRWKQTTKAMVRRKGIVKAAAVSSVPKQ